MLHSADLCRFTSRQPTGSHIAFISEAENSRIRNDLFRQAPFCGDRRNGPGRSTWHSAAIIYPSPLSPLHSGWSLYGYAILNDGGRLSSGPEPMVPGTEGGSSTALVILPHSIDLLYSGGCADGLISCVLGLRKNLGYHHQHSGLSRNLGLTHDLVSCDRHEEFLYRAVEAENHLLFRQLKDWTTNPRSRHRSRLQCIVPQLPSM